MPFHICSPDPDCPQCKGTGTIHWDHGRDLAAEMIRSGFTPGN